uniref:Uncharacterized protein n=1 Tax=Anguilla anguilla TaxID=7936 RepID=A0A0E9QEB2_ANGAN
MDALVSVAVTAVWSSQSFHRSHNTHQSHSSSGKVLVFTLSIACDL